jgi:hypothetical protein
MNDDDDDDGEDDDDEVRSVKCVVLSVKYEV